MACRVTRDDKTFTVEGLMPYAGYLMYRSIIADRPAEDWTFGELAEHSVFNEVSILRGLDRLLDLGEQGQVWRPLPLLPRVLPGSLVPRAFASAGSGTHLSGMTRKRGRWQGP